MYLKISVLRRSRQRNIFFIIRFLRDVLTLNHKLGSYKPAHYLIDRGGLNELWPIQSEF